MMCAADLELEYMANYPWLVWATPLSEGVEHWAGMQESRVQFPTETRNVFATFGAQCGPGISQC